MKKRILTVLLAVCLVFALGTVTALADDNAVTLKVNSSATYDSGNVPARAEGATYKTLEEAISNAASGDTIEIESNLDADISKPTSNNNGVYQITKNLTIDGNGNTITAKGTANSSAGVKNVHVFNISGTGLTVSIKNVIIDGNNIAKHGVNVYNETGTTTVNLTGVTSKDNIGYGVCNGGASVVASGLNTSGNGWGGVNVDPNVNTKASFSMSSGNLAETASIVLDSDPNQTNTVNLTGGTYETVMTNTPDENVERSQGTNNISVSGATVGTISLNGTGTDTVNVSKSSRVTNIVSGHADTNKPSVTVTDSTVGNMDKAKFNLTANGSTINGTQQTDYVAKVGDTYYDDLQAAINAAPANGTVTLLKDIEVDLANVTNALYSINGNVTIDGNGKKIAVKDGSEKEVKIFNVVNATVKFEDLTIDGNDVARHGIQAYGTNCVVTLDNVNSKNTTGYGILANGGAKVTATKLYTSGNGWGGVNVESKDGATEFTMTSGTLADTYSVVVENSGTTTKASKVNLRGGTYNNIQIKTANTSVAISGGTYRDIVGSSDPKYTLNGTEVSITGGTFSYRQPSSYVDVDYLVAGSDYSYYSTFSSALSAAVVGDSIECLNNSIDTYEVEFSYEKNVSDTYEVPKNTSITLPTGTYDSKTIEGWKRDYDGEVFKAGASVKITRNTDFTVILRNGQYNIVIDDDIKHGDVSTDVSSADKGATVYIYVDPDIGYVLDDLNVYYGANNRYSVTVSYVRAGVYKFTMPNASVYITATFKYAALPFTDVNRSQWFYDEVYYVYTNGMMEGDSATTFNPDGRMTRAMFWAVLGRIDGATITGNDWAEEARAWAMREGVSDGTNPNDYVTREQMVTMLWRYAGEKNGSASLIRYTDADKISSYAVEAMRWAIGNGIIEGMTSTTLEPQGTATRAQCAAIFMRFDQM